MSHSLASHALVVVADGGGALLLRNTGAGGDVVLTEERRLSPKDFHEDGPSGSRPGDQTPKQTGEATFAKQLAHTLSAMHGNNGFKELVLIADPQTLGQLRDALGKGVEHSVVASLSKDLTHQSLKEITAAVTKAL